MSGARRWLADEVVQSSAMDCGPAALKSLLGGFGIAASYGRLREACQTDVDGTSIDTLETLADQLGLCVEQILLPADALELPEAAALPAIAVVRLPHGPTHFVVLWRRHGSLVQLMDPATGRRWVTWRKLREELYLHEAELPLATWQEWATSEGFLRVLRARLRRLRIAPAALLEPALQGGAVELCMLDAALRSVEALHRAGAVANGQPAQRLLRARLREAAQGDLTDEWFAARPLPASPDEPPRVRVRGAVLVRALGRRSELHSPAAPEAPDLPPPPLRPALQQPARHPLRDLLALLGSRGPAVLTWLCLGMILLCVGITGEAVLLRSLLDIGPQLGLWTQRLELAAMTLLLGAGLFSLSSVLQSQVYHLGRQLEIRLRGALLATIPRLEDRYFQSRPLSDMVERAHKLHRIHEVPAFLLQMGSAVCQTLITTAALIWLDPGGARFTLLFAASGIGLPLAFLPILSEQDLRTRSHQGALARFFFDALRGLIPIRAHGAESAVRGEQEGLLTDWARARLDVGRTVTALVGAAPLLSLVMLGLLWQGQAQRTRELGTILLLMYWSFSLLFFGQRLALGVRQYPLLRNTLLRLLEPLQAMTQPVVAPQPASRAPAAGAAVRLVDVTLVLAGRPVLTGLHLDLPAGSHVAIVGRSGAGKSSLFGLLLGFHSPASGSLEVDGCLLGLSELAALRERTAWLDPQVQLWNRSLLENLCYGTVGAPDDLGPVLRAAELHGLLDRMPLGLSTPLGESGACVSGGEGQRVRFGRALLRQDARLVLLDEPFRGLDRSQRATLLARTRSAFAAATLLCATHDVGDTQSFPRVLVVEDGRLVEAGSPAELLARPGSRYRALLEAEQDAQRSVWAAPIWRRLQLDGGALAETRDQPTRLPGEAAEEPHA